MAKPQTPSAIYQTHEPSLSGGVTESPWTDTPKTESNTLLESHFQEPYHNYLKNPGPETSGPLLTAIKPVLDESLRSYGGSESATATARARAKVLALEAVDRYDPSRAKLRTHLLSHLRGLRRSVERSTAGVYMPEQWRIDSRRVDASTSDARDELGREPSDAEIADRTSLPIGRVRRARNAPGVLATSQFDSPIAFDNPDEKAWNVWVEGIYHDLDPVDQVILEHSFGLHGKKVRAANQIADMLKLSGGAVSQRKAKIQKMLDTYDSFTYGRSKP